VLQVVVCVLRGVQSETFYLLAHVEKNSGDGLELWAIRTDKNQQDVVLTFPKNT
jgi:hypothetical protein